MTESDRPADIFYVLDFVLGQRDGNAFIGIVNISVHDRRGRPDKHDQPADDEDHGDENFNDGEPAFIPLPTKASPLAGSHVSNFLFQDVFHD